MTKGLSRKQIIIPMESNNMERIMTQSNVYIANINQQLKYIKSETLVDFMYFKNKIIIIIINEVATSLDLDIMEKYIKKINNVDLSNIMSLKFP